MRDEAGTITDADVERHERAAEEAAEEYRQMRGAQALRVYEAIFQEARDFMDDDYAADTAHEAVKNYLACGERDAA